jgi:rhodanese-related sulfurtransferase
MTVTVTMTPTPTVDRLLQANWNTSMTRSRAGVPHVNVDFVSEQGRAVLIIDLRDDADVVGPLGHIPGAWRLDAAELPRLARELPPIQPIVLVSRTGERAGTGAQYLEMLGMRMVAALEGGMLAWRATGLTSSRDAAFLARRFDVALFGARPAPAAATDDIALADIEAHVGDPGAVRWVKLAAFLVHGKRSCVDGRDDKGVVGMAGGDAGELVLGMAAVEHVTGTTLDRGEVERILARHFDTFGRFYLHSDQHAMNAFILDMRKDPRIADGIRHLDAPEEWRAFMTAPPEALRPPILEHLLRPEHIGCGHLKLMLTRAAEYEVREALVTDFFRAYHTIRWAGAPEPLFVVLGGKHAERAVLSVVLEDELWPLSQIPLVSPRIEGHQMFVNHPQVSSWYRQQTASFLLHETLGLSALEAKHEEALRAEIERLGAKQLGATLEALAKGLPVFEVRFARDGTVRASQKG